MMKTYQNHAMTDAEARQALADACKQVETNLPLYTYQCQNHSSVNNIYPGCANNQWTCGFWPGEIWLAYEATGDEKFKTAALIQVDSFADRIARKVEVDHHDMGFLYSPTCVAAWKLVGSEKGKNAAIAAADQLPRCHAGGAVQKAHIVVVHLHLAGNAIRKAVHLNEGGVLEFFLPGGFVGQPNLPRPEAAGPLVIGAAGVDIANAGMVQALADACKQVETNLPLYTYQGQKPQVHWLLAQPG